MKGFDLVQSATWEIALPSDWSQVDKPSGEVYFESADETKGLYIASWRIEQVPGTDSRSVAKRFRRVEQASLVQMQGYEWETLSEDLSGDGQAPCVASSDAFARAQGYRIASKILARLPIVIRAVFHDYLCEDLDASQLYFAPVIHSLKIRDDAV